METYRLLLDAYDDLYYRFRRLALKHDISTEDFRSLTQWSQRARRRALRLWGSEHHARKRARARARARKRARRQPRPSLISIHQHVANIPKASRRPA